MYHKIDLRINRIQVAKNIILINYYLKTLGPARSTIPFNQPLHTFVLKVVYFYIECSANTDTAFISST